MADTAGGIYAEFGQHLAHTIAEQSAAAQKRQAISQGMQSYLDMARRMQIPDPQTGKPKDVFDQKSLDIIQNMLAHHNTAGAAAQEAAMGIGKGMIDRYNTAAAKQQAAYQTATQGPNTFTGPMGQPYIQRGNNWYTNTAKPQNQMGLTAEDQLNLQKGIAKDATQAQMAQFKAQQQAKLSQTKIFSAFLKSNGIASPTDLFDPSVQEGGISSPQTGFANTPAGSPQSHIRFYYEPPEKNADGSVKTNNKGEPIGGKPGVVLPQAQVIDMQNAAASMAGPQALQALQWLRENPDNKHAAAVAAEISNRMGKIDEAPQPQPFNPSPPSFAPAQPPGVMPQQQAPPTVAATDPLPNTPPPEDSPDDTGD